MLKKRYFESTFFSEASMLDIVLRIFLLPGNLVGDAIGARSEDDRTTVRVMTNMLFWNTVLVIVAFKLAF
jgi:hypothetical protein